MTEPTVFRGREISTVWLGLSGACTWRGAAGARPKLGREKPPQGWQGEQVLTHARWALQARVGTVVSKEALHQAGLAQILG